MNTDQIAEIRDALHEAIDCTSETWLTLEVSDDCDKWLQVIDRTINAAYPYQEYPEVILQDMLASPQVREVSSWEPEKFVEIKFHEIELDEIVTWVDSYFVKALGCAEGDYHLDIEYETSN